MKELRFTLVTEGTSDKALIPHLVWLLKQNGLNYSISPVWADLRMLPKRPNGLSEKIEKSLELYPCDLLFVHRDADRDDFAARNARKTEIQQALNKLNPPIAKPLSICVIPVRMQEAWLLFDEPAIRRAAGNPNGNQPLNLPKLKTIEHEPDPKNLLYEILRQASGLSGRRRKNFNESHSAVLVSESIEDFAPLRALSAFKTLEDDIVNTIPTLQLA